MAQKDNEKKAKSKFKVEVIYREAQDKKDQVRQLWDLLVALPDPDSVKQKSKLEK